MKISFTGTQTGMTNGQKRLLKKILIDKHCSELVTGECIGADYEAVIIAVECGVKYFTFYPSNLSKKRKPVFPTGDWAVWHEFEDIKYRKYPLKPPLERNTDIVNASDVLIACTKEFGHTLRSGTWATIRRGWKAKKDVIVIPPIMDDEN